MSFIYECNEKNTCDTMSDKLTGNNIELTNQLLLLVYICSYNIIQNDQYLASLPVFETTANLQTNIMERVKQSKFILKCLINSNTEVSA